MTQPATYNFPYPTGLAPIPEDEIEELYRMKTLLSHQNSYESNGDEDFQPLTWPLQKSAASHHDLQESLSRIVFKENSPQTLQLTTGE